jgi:hypothetical protein
MERNGRPPNPPEAPHWPPPPRIVKPEGPPPQILRDGQIPPTPKRRLSSQLAPADSAPAWKAFAICLVLIVAGLAGFLTAVIVLGQVGRGQ